jgi:hypothetical protein
MFHPSTFSSRSIEFEPAGRLRYLLSPSHSLYIPSLGLIEVIERAALRIMSPPLTKSNSTTPFFISILILLFRKRSILFRCLVPTIIIIHCPHLTLLFTLTTLLVRLVLLGSTNRDNKFVAGRILRWAMWTVGWSLFWARVRLFSVRLSLIGRESLF